MMKSLMSGLFSVIKRFFVALLSTLGIAVLFGYILERMESIVNARLYETLGRGTTLFTAIIGTPLHEIAHWLGCKIFGFNVIEVELLRPFKYREDGIWGYVKYFMDSSNAWQRFGCFFVGIAPLILGSLFILMVIKLLKPEIPLNIKDKVSKVSSNGKRKNGIAVGFAAFCGFWKGLFSLKNWGWLRGIICLYIVMSISMHMTISDADIEGAKVGIWIVLAVYGIFALITAMIGCDYIIPGAKTAAFLSGFFSIGLLADALLLAIALLFSGRAYGEVGGIFNTVNLNKYVEVSCDGYEHYGTVTVTFDEEKFVKRYGRKVGRYAANELAEYFGIDISKRNLGREIASDVCDTLGTPKADKSKKLSNGDVVTFTWKEQAQGLFSTFSILEEETGLRFKYEDFSYTVSGLTITDTFDPFAEVTVDIEGISGQATFTFNTISSETKYDISYSPKRETNLENGDKVTVEVSVGNVKEYMKSHTALPYPNEKTYEIRGLDYYATSTTEIGREFLDKIDSLAIEEAMAASDSWVEECKIESAENIGYIFLAGAKEYALENEYVSVIKVHVVGDFEERFEMDYYVGVEYGNFVISNASSSYGESHISAGSNTIKKEGPFKRKDGREYSELLFKGYSSIDELVNYYKLKDRVYYKTMEENVVVE